MKRNLLLLTFAATTLCGMAQTGTANNNVVVNGETSKLELFADYPVSIPENFEAESVDIHRNVRSGYNTFYLPFYVNRDEIPSDNGKTYIYNTQDNSNVTFERKDGIDANMPFLMTKVTASNILTFNNRKGVVMTPESNANNIFVGIYDGTISAYDKWGIGNADNFVRGGTNATIKSFAAYLTVPIGDVSNSKHIVLSDFDELTGTEKSLSSLSHSPLKKSIYNLLQVRKVSNTYALPKGIYIINGKKILVK